MNNHPFDVVLIGSPGDRRVSLFQEALTGLGLQPAQLVAYSDLLAARMSLAAALRPGAILRIESPGKDFSAERAILALGAETEDDDPDAAHYERLSRRSVEALTFEKGRILPSRQWYLGYRALLRQIASQIEGYRVMNLPTEIALMFDKRACHASLSERGIAVPPALAPMRGYDELIAQMRQIGWSRVFVKLAHGSSASGVVAFRTHGDQQQAITTVEMVRSGGEVKLYNTRQIRTYTKPSEIAALINALCRQRTHVERWMPKASYEGRVFDLRVVVIAGHARHVVARLSFSPMTNLHLLNERGDLAAISAMLGPARWQAALQTCEHAVQSFASLYSGVDLLFTTDHRRHAIVEMNAFGDLLPGLLHAGQDTYTAEIAALLAGREPHTPSTGMLAAAHEGGLQC